MLQTHVQKLNPEKKFFNQIMNHGFLVYMILIVLLLCAEVIIPGFLKPDHVGSLLKMAAFTGIAAIGQTFVILIGGIDMSIANVVTLSNIVAAQLMVGNDSNILIAVAAILFTGAAVGFANASGINFLRIPPMIMTLGVGTVLEGVMLLYSKGAPKGNTAPMIRSLVNDTSILNVFAPIVLIWIALSVIVICVLNSSTFGRKVYITGSNPIVARFSGINEKKIIYICYIISGISAALTGLLLAGYTGTASAESGEAYSMNTIVAVVLGGTAITGGKGGYSGTIAGAIIMAVIENILLVINIPISGRIIAQGLIVLIMVLIYGRSKKIV